MEETRPQADMELQKEDVFPVVEEIINEVKKSRDAAEKASKNGLKSNPFSTLEKRGLMNAEFVTSEFDKIQAKASSLPSGERSVINKIMVMALQKVALRKYQEMNPEESKEPENANQEPSEGGKPIPKRKRSKKPAQKAE